MTPQQIVDVGNTIRATYPRAFSKCHVVGDPEAWDFIILFAKACNAIDSLIGCNGKRGNVNDMSYDALFIKPSSVIDVVAGAGGPSPTVYYNDVSSQGPGAFIDPTTKNTVYNYGSTGGGGTTPTDCPQKLEACKTENQKLKTANEILKAENTELRRHQQPHPYEQDKVTQLGNAVAADYARAGQSLNAGSFDWYAQTITDYHNGMPWNEALAKHRAEWCGALGIPVQ